MFSSKKINLRTITCCGATLFCLLQLAPRYFLFPAPGTGLDSSWQLSLILAFRNGLIFGRDYVFTYGPLAFLSLRFPESGLLSAYYLFDLGLLFLLIPLICEIWNSKPNWKTWTLLCSTCLTYGLLDHGLDLPFSLLFLCFFHLFNFVRFRNIFSFLSAVILSLLIFYIKPSVGLAAILGVSAVLISDLSLRHLLFYAGCLLLSAFWLPVDLPNYFSTALEFSRGYDDAMYFPLKDSRLLAAVLVPGAIFVAAILANFKQAFSTRSAVWQTLLTCGALFLLFKQSFVRADAHVETFIRFAPLFIGLYCRNMQDRLRRHTSLALLLFVGFSVCFFTNGRTLDDVFTAHLKGLLRYSKEFVTGQISVTEETALPPGTKLPHEILAHIGNDTVDVIPWNIAYAYYNHLTYNPRPVIQSYAAYTEKLDRLNSAKYESDSAPKHLLFSFDCIDLRYCFWDETQTKIAMLEHYQPHLVSGEFLVLDRHAPALRPHETTSSTGRAHLNQWITPLDDSRITLAKVNLRYSPIGSLKSFFYKVPPLNVEFELADGKTITHRAVKNILQGGVIWNFYVNSVSDTQLFFADKEKQLPRIKRLRFISSEPWAFEKSFEYSESTLSLEEIATTIHSDPSKAQKTALPEPPAK